MSTLRNYGYDRDRSGCPQVVLGLVITKDGIPLCHHVFPGETPDKSTLKEVVLDLKVRFPIKRCILVGDRGLLSEDNLEILTEAELDYIVSMPLRGNQWAKRIVKALADQVKDKRKVWEQNKTPLSKQQCFLEVVIDGRRFVLSHSEEIARQTKNTRKSALSQATSYVTWRVARTLAQHNGTYPCQGKGSHSPGNLAQCS